MKAFARNHAAIIASIAIAATLVIVALALPGGARESGADVSVPAKATLSDYTWNELALISAKLSRCASQEEAVALATRYGLCGRGGSLDDGSSKGVVLSDGTEMRAQLIGIWHDERTDGGKAGLTFMLTRPLGEHAMNHSFESADGDDPDSVGGWHASDMRAWLNGTAYFQLPPDLRTCIASAQKVSASTVSSRDELDVAGSLVGTGRDWAVESSDKLWLLSASELCGNVPEHRGLGVDATMAAVYAAEGDQYRLFANWGVAAFKANDALASLVGEDSDGPCTWWLRTKTLEFGDGFWLVGTDGTPLNGLGEDERVATDSAYAPSDLWGPDHARAVIACFCL